MQFALLPLTQRQRLPSCFFPYRIMMTICSYISLNCRFPHLSIFGLHTIKPTPICRSTLLDHIQTPLPKQTWEVHIIPIWITEGKNCINACNKNWLKDLAKENSEEKWKINCIHKDPYSSALSTEETPGLHIQQPPSSNPTRPPRLNKYLGPTSEL